MDEVVLAGIMGQENNKGALGIFISTGISGLSAESCCFVPVSSDPAEIQEEFFRFF